VTINTAVQRELILAEDFPLCGMRRCSCVSMPNPFDFGKRDAVFR
jgi:hypothetical protein